MGWFPCSLELTKNLCLLIILFKFCSTSWENNCYWISRMGSIPKISRSDDTSDKYRKQLSNIIDTEECLVPMLQKLQTNVALAVSAIHLSHLKQAERSVSKEKEFFWIWGYSWTNLFWMKWTIVPRLPSIYHPFWQSRCATRLS